MSSVSKTAQSGVLFQPGIQSLPVENAYPKAFAQENLSAKTSEDTGAKSFSHKLAFAGLFLFTFLLYARPQEMFPQVFGDFPLVKIVAIATLLVYFVAKLTTGERLTIWPLELPMVLAIGFLGFVFMPIALSAKDSLDVLLDTYLKVAIIFLLMINLIDTRKRLRQLWKLVIICGTGLATIAVYNYLVGDFAVKYQGKGFRIRIGGPEGFFGNPNDLAMIFVLLLPLAVSFALSNRGLRRTAYIASAALLTTGVVVTFSRGGFLGLMATGAVLMWKAGRGNRAISMLAGALILGVFIAMTPISYVNRITSIFDQSQDLTGSGAERRELLARATEVASNHLVVGVGMGNYHSYSLRERLAHNSYLEISAELGVAGLIAFLILIFAPLRSLRRLERKAAGPLFIPSLAGRNRETYYMSVTLQAALVGFMVCSFFGSVQYQWFLYFLVAYTVALKQIYRREHPELTLMDRRGVLLEQATTINRKPGVLWRPHQLVKSNVNSNQARIPNPQINSLRRELPVSTGGLNPEGEGNR